MISEEAQRRLVERVRDADDHEAFGELVGLHQGAVRQFLRRLSGSPSASADDLAQETFWRAYRNLSSFRGEGRFRSWLFSIGYQCFVAAERRRRRRPTMPWTTATEAKEPAATAGDAAAIEATQTVQRLLAGLRREERAAILLHYQHELSHDEVASSLGLPLGTVKSLIRRGKAKMKQMHQAPSAGRAR
ncbi:MAG: RNA polymerase sigma factor [Acidobacteriota bacterium]